MLLMPSCATLCEMPSSNKVPPKDKRDYKISLLVGLLKWPLLFEMLSSSSSSYPLATKVSTFSVMKVSVAGHWLMAIYWAMQSLMPLTQASMKKVYLHALFCFWNVANNNNMFEKPHTDCLRSPDDASMVDAKWTYRSANSLATVNECIANRPSACIRRTITPDENSTPLSHNRHGHPYTV